MMHRKGHLLYFLVEIFCWKITFNGAGGRQRLTNLCTNETAAKIAK
jgi:hypothetical protein